MGFTPQIYISGWAQVDVNGFNLGWILQKIPFCNPTHFPGSQPFSSTLSMSILLKLAVKWHISQCSSSKPRGSIPSAYTRAKETRANELMKVLTLFFFFAFSLCSQQHREAGKIVKDQDELFVLRGQDSEGAGWGGEATGLREWRKLKDCWRCKDANSHKTWESTSTLHICRDLQKERGMGGVFAS